MLDLGAQPERVASELAALVEAVRPLPASPNLIDTPPRPADPRSEYRRESVRTGIRMFVARDDEPYVFDTFDDAVVWLTALRDRLGRYLPTPAEAR